MSTNPKDRQRAYSAKWYAANREVQSARTAVHRKAYREWAKTLKDGLACERCGEDHPVCLDFHHVDPALKKFEIAAAVGRRLSKARILAEIDKCLVLCANCHRKEHAALAQSGRAPAL